MSLPERFAREDESSDAVFYAQPRFVYHLDAAAVDAVTQFYQSRMSAGMSVLDLMSSWVSHLPAALALSHVAGLGMNDAELAANPRLDRYVVHDLNTDPRLPFDADLFDAACICASVDYLVQPMAVLTDLARVVVVGGSVLITFSNRCFPTKVIEPWLHLDDAGRRALVVSMLEQTQCWSAIESLDISPALGRSDPLYAIVARRRAD